MCFGVYRKFGDCNEHKQPQQETTGLVSTRPFLAQVRTISTSEACE